MLPGNIRIQPPCTLGRQAPARRAARRRAQDQRKTQADIPAA